MKGETQAACAIWERWEHAVDNEGNVQELLSHSQSKNLEVNTGRSRLISLAFVPSASAGLGGFYSLGVGASATAAAVTDIQLTYELIGNATRKTLTDANGNVPSGSIPASTTIGGVNYYEKIVLQAVYLTGDGNNGNVFNEYGLFSSNTLPGSPTGVSGVMFNHYIDPAPVTKSVGNQVTVQISIFF